MFARSIEARPPQLFFSSLLSLSSLVVLLALRQLSCEQLDGASTVQQQQQLSGIAKDGRTDGRGSGRNLLIVASADLSRTKVR
jgi:hypothetical protein